jgi:lysophospholipase L1-like esterase
MSRAVIIGTLAMAALACCAEAPSSHPIASVSALPAGAHYVAMGSSYAAGAGIGPTKPGTPERCGRTTNNYASLLADQLTLDLDDQSCGGATTEHLLSAWEELPAQIDAVTPETRLVTITVGGNDLNYMGLVFTASCDPAVGMIVGGEQRECPSRVHLPEEAAYSQVEENLHRVATIIRARAPQARIVFVQYVTLVGEHMCSDLPIDATAATEARELAARLAVATRRAAERSGSMVLPAESLSATHTACDGESWSRGYPANYDASAGAPWHPTALGHAAIAHHLTELLGS